MTRSSSQRQVALGLCVLGWAVCWFGWGDASSAHASPVHSHDAATNALDLARLSRDAEFVFSGRIVDVSYRRSEPNAAGAEGIPHTFVTYEVERVFKGRAQGDRVSLRFMGGPISSSRFVHSEGTPYFDLGDRDTLFVRGNTVAECPLVQCDGGRLRVINDKVYTESGQRVERGPGDALRRGGWEELDAVMTHHMTDTIKLRFVETQPPTQTSDSAPLRAHTLTAALSALNSRSSASASAPFRNAVAGEPFHYDESHVSSPQVAAARPRSVAPSKASQAPMSRAAPAPQPLTPAAASSTPGSADAWFWLWPLAAALAVWARFQARRARQLGQSTQQRERATRRTL